MTNQRLENGKTLAALLGIGLDEAVALLNVKILLTADSTDASGQAILRHLREMLRRTVSQVDAVPDGSDYAAEAVVGGASARTSRAVRLFLDDDVVEIGPEASAMPISDHVHELSLLLAACYGCGAVLRAGLGGLSELPGPSWDQTFVVPLEVFYGKDRRWMAAQIELVDTYLAGAGAIGNGFLYALRSLLVSGEVNIVDNDLISGGNLNRCVWFDESDIDESKAERLVTRAQRHFPQLKLIPRKMILQDAKESLGPNWLGRLIVAIDTRRGRRSLQNEVPGEVFDASTTGVEEIVVHHHRQPTEAACLACIYYESPDELSRERHVAQALGVTLAQVQENGGVSPLAALAIAAKYPRYAPQELVGLAYDSLFKSLCSEMAIKGTLGQQVLAPFCFVSVLAGACLTIELGRRLYSGSASPAYNYWYLSPWAPPVDELKQVRGREPKCGFCSKDSHRNFAAKLWGVSRT